MSQFEWLPAMTQYSEIPGWDEVYDAYDPAEDPEEDDSWELLLHQRKYAFPLFNLLSLYIWLIFQPLLDHRCNVLTPCL